MKRVDKVLQDAAIKLGSVASRTLGKSGRATVEALIAGERDPERLAGLAPGKLRPKIPQLVRALDGRFGEHHAVLLRLHLDHVNHLDAAVATLDAPFAEVRRRLMTIPGVAGRVAEVTVAEIGVDTDRCPTAEQLASWAGLCPGDNESAGKHYSGRTRKGDGWLTQTLVQAAWAAARTKDTYPSAQFWQLARRIGKNTAAAVAHSILTVAYHAIDRKVDYIDLGGDYFARRVDPQRRTRQLVRQLVRQLEALGHSVTLAPAA